MSETNQPSNDQLKYFISSNNSIMVVVFAGSFYRDSISILEKCQSELLDKSPRQVILVFRDIGSRVELPLLSGISKLKKAIRDIPADLRICSLHPELRTLMDSKGILRLDELDNNMNDSIKKLRALSNKP